MGTGGDDFTLRVWDLQNDNEKSVHVFEEGHAQQIRCVSFSHNNEVIASGGYDKVILLWSVSAVKRLLHTLHHHTSSVECICFSRNDKLLCSGSWDYSAALWDTDNGSLLSTLKHHKSVVQCCSFSDFSNMLATGSWDYSIFVYDVTEESKLGDLIQSGSQIGEDLIVSNVKRLQRHESNIKCVQFSCRDLLASTSWDCTVCIWNALTGDCLHVLKGHEGFVQTCTFSTDGMILASAEDDGTVKVWSVKDGGLVKTLEAYTEEIHQLSFTPEGTLLASGPRHISVCLYY